MKKCFLFLKEKVCNGFSSLFGFIDKHIRCFYLWVITLVIFISFSLAQNLEHRIDIIKIEAEHSLLERDYVTRVKIIKDLQEILTEQDTWIRDARGTLQMQHDMIQRLLAELEKSGRSI